jgi:hypothetical protein
MKTTDLRIADVRVTENAGGLPSNVETRPLPEARWTARGGATSRLLRFCVKAPNTNSEIGTTRLARPRVRNKMGCDCSKGCNVSFLASETRTISGESAAAVFSCAVALAIFALVYGVFYGGWVAVLPLSSWTSSAAGTSAD